jgi:aryl sulfotransferase
MTAEPDAHPSGAHVRYRNLIYDNARWSGFAFRGGDVVISTPPKAGTTWMQTICALLILQRADRDATIDELSPWMEMSTRTVEEVHARLAAQEHRRFIKSHIPLDGLPWDPRVTYVCVGRDPRDMAVSWDNHASNINMEAVLAARARAVGTGDLTELMPPGPPRPPPADPRERFWAYADAVPGSAPGPCLAAVVHHLATFWAVRDRPNVVLLHYADLQADLDGQMRRLAARLGIDVAAEAWPTLVEAATFSSMAARGDVPEASSNTWIAPSRFFHRGTSGQWRDLLDADDERRYAARVGELADGEFLRWLHEGGPV